MDNDSFIGTTNGLKKILENDHSAFINAEYHIKHSENYKNCKIDLIPWREFIGSLSIPMVKSSPYEPFLREQIIGLYANGIIRSLEQQWSPKAPECLKPKVKEISLEKVIVSFTWIAIGIGSSLVILIMEKLYKFANHNQFNQTNEPINSIIEEDIENYFEHLLYIENVPVHRLLEIFQKVVIANERKARLK